MAAAARAAGLAGAVARVSAVAGKAEVLTLIGWLFVGLAAFIFLGSLGGFVNPAWMADKKTGAVVPRWKWFFAAWFGPVVPAAIGITMLIMSSDGSNRLTPEESAEARLALRPEMIVVSKEGYACSSRGALDQSVRHAVAGEKTKFSAMFKDSTCVAYPAGVSFKVLSADKDAAEIVNAKNVDASVGMWTLSTALEHRSGD